MFSKILRRRTRGEAQTAKLARHHPGVAHRADLHDGIEPFIGKVRHAVAKLCVNRQIRVLLGEVQQFGHHDPTTESDGHLHAKPTVRIGGAERDRALGVVDFGQDVTAALEEGSAFVGQADQARRSLQQPHAEFLLEARHGFAHR